MAEETTQKKKAPAKKEAVKFFFPKNAKKSYYTQTLSVKAENNLYIVDPADSQYTQILKFLRDNKENMANGGTTYTELTKGTEEESDRGKLIDTLLSMDCKQLRKICGGDVELELVKSKGQLIDTYLKQQEM